MDTDFKVLVWNGDGSGKASTTGSVNSGATGMVSVDAPTGSLIVLTTVAVGVADNFITINEKRRW